MVERLNPDPSHNAKARRMGPACGRHPEIQVRSSGWCRRMAHPLLFDAQRVTTIDFSEGRATLDSWRSVTMNDLTTTEPANDPQDLERLLVARENAGDVTGMTALFEPDAVVDIGGGTFLRGKEAIHEFFTKLQVTGFGPEKRKFEFGEQRPALICGDLALTSTRSRNGTVTSEVARRQKDGTWLWVIDRYFVSW